MFPVCYMLYRYGCFLFVTCCTDIGISCLLHVVQIWVFPVCYMLYRSKCFLFIICCTDLEVRSEASQDIQCSLLQHFSELLVAGV